MESWGNTSANIQGQVQSVVYQNEMVSPTEDTTVDAQIGLMYVNDYVFAAKPSYWIYQGRESSDLPSYALAAASNWMFMGIKEYTITRTLDNSYCSNFVFYVATSGSIETALAYESGTGYDNPIRPVFYLNSDVTYTSGTGTSTDPIRIN